MLEAILRPLPIYVKIYENRFVLKLVGSSDESITVLPDEPFTTKRLLIGGFTVALATLKHGFEKAAAGRRWFVFARAVMHPKDRMDGGLSEVERRLLQELAEQAGATWAVVWEGQDLSDEEALYHLDNPRTDSS